MPFDQNTKIAFLGLGLMGSRMTKRLLQAGFDVAVWNRSPHACDALITLGAVPLALNKIGDYPIILQCVANDHAANNVFNLIQPYLSAQQIIVDFSSLSVATTHDLATQAATQHVTWIDSPVSGGTIGAEQGNLVVFAGGNAQTITALMPIYQVLSQRVTHMGEVGTGQSTKICNQLIVAANSALIAEAVALAAQAGVDTRKLAAALADGFADSKPLQILAPRMANHIFEPIQWKVQTLSKDLNNALQLAKKFNLNIPVAAQAFDQLHQHKNQGYAETDLATLIKHVEI